MYCLISETMSSACTCVLADAQFLWKIAAVCLPAGAVLVTLLIGFRHRRRRRERDGQTDPLGQPDRPSET